MIDDNLICQQWLRIKEKEVKSLTYDKYETIINKYLLPFLKENPMSTLTPIKIAEFLNLQNNAGLSAYMVNLIKLILNSICDYAHNEYNYRSIDFNKIRLDLDKEVKSSENLTKEQEDILYQYCLLHIDSLSVSILLALYTGLRSSEICALKIKDVHLDEGYIDVSKKVQRNVNRQNTDSKTLFHTVELSWPEKRQVVLQPFLIDYLKGYIEYDYDELYLLSRTFKLPVKRTYQNKIKQLGQELGFEISYGKLRNTCKDNCIKNNVSINTILNMLGISKIEINIDDVYNEEIDYKRQQMIKIQPEI
ncbi:MAG: site-specific integrase [Erysipelotrichaceae bacterium]|nr:site-specific integrase [Erysipelotrichaceae bacterium]